MRSNQVTDFNFFNLRLGIKKSSGIEKYTIEIINRFKMKSLSKFLIFLFAFIVNMQSIQGQTNNIMLIDTIKKNDFSINNYFDFSVDDIKVLPDSVFRFKYIARLGLCLTPNLKWDIVANQLTNFTRIDELVLCERGLIEIPVELAIVKNVIRLDLRSNAIRKINHNVSSQMNNLIDIDLGYNHLENLSVEELDSLFISLSYFPDLKRLSISGNGLDTIPNSILLLKNLKSLDIAENNFDHLPEVLIRMDQLTEIRVDCYPSLYFTEFLRTLKKKISICLKKEKTEKFPWYDEADYARLNRLYPMVDFW